MCVYFVYCDDMWCTDMVFRPSSVYGHDIETQPLNFSKPRTPSLIMGCTSYRPRN